MAEADSAGAEWLTARGYACHHTAWILRLDPRTPIRSRDLPEGYAVRPFAPADAEAAYAVILEAFGEWETSPERSFASWRAATLGRPGVDPTASRVATYAGEVVGAEARTFIDDGEEDMAVASFGGHSDRGAGWGVREGVVDQVVECLGQQLGVGTDVEIPGGG